MRSFWHLWASFISIVECKRFHHEGEKEKKTNMQHVGSLKLLTPSKASPKTAGDVKWKHWQIACVCELSAVAGCDLTTIFPCLCHLHLYIFYICDAYAHASTERRALSSPPTIQMAARATRLYWFFDMSVHSMRIWCASVTPGDVVGKLNNISVHYCSWVGQLFRSSSFETTTWHVLCMGWLMRSYF